ncbi:MAG: PadR family transcriptional regulator [Alistipes sp.]|nr:PadR family transcriptional regulator [Candidatus Alistipes equi]
MKDENIKTQMRKGVIDYCVMSILKNGEAYAPSIISKLQQAQMIVVEGTLYPTLSRLKNAGYLTYRWEESTQGPPRKYYSLTKEGKEYLRILDDAWVEMVEQINAIRNC